jgi:septal ring factor EnvC (AmiA/AmiB activator)
MMRFARSTAVGALFAVLLSVNGHAATSSRSELGDAESRRAKLEQQRRDADAKRRGLLSQERSVLAVIEDLDRRIDTAKKAITKLDAEIAEINRSIAVLEETIGVLTDKLNARRQLVANRLRANYKITYNNANGFFALASRADNLSDMLVRLEYVKRIRLYDDRVIAQFVADNDRLTSQKSELESQQAKRLTQQTELDRQQKTLAREQNERKATLESIRRDRSLQERTVREVDASIRQLNALIRQLEARIAAEEAAARGSRTTAPSASVAEAPRPEFLGSTGEVSLAIQTFGKIDWPVEGKIVSNASDALEGITIRASEGAPVKAVLDGTVEYAQWFNGLGFGKLLVVNHGNGYRSFYAHLSDFSVKEGQRVRKGQIVGTVGNTGSLIGNALYFEMRRQFNVLDFRRIAR